MYTVNTSNGDSYVVNSHHILTFHISIFIKYNTVRDRYVLSWGDITGTVKYRHFKTLEEAKKWSEKLPRLIDLPILECIEKNKKKYWREYFQGVYNGISFPEKKIKLDPYMLGLWLGDGDKDNPIITNIDTEIVEYLQNSYEKNNYIFKLETRDDISYEINGSIDLLEEYNVLNNKHIPLIYKTNSRHNRLQLLAGLLDSDGHLKDDFNTFEIIQKKRVLANDIYFLAKSLGYQVSLKECQKSYIYKGEQQFDTFYRIHISGNTAEIPVIINRKKASIRKQVNNHMVSQITIEAVGINTYYGFELDGNHRFLLGNFIITHNTSVVKLFIKVYKQTKIMGITSTTGISALLFGGTTLHSFLGIGLGTSSVETLIAKIFKRSYLRKRWNELEVLIIDEISMLSPELFDKLEYIARSVRHDDRPFGGIQLILSGDFLQLQCINSDNFCFESENWSKCIDHTVYLTEIMRQKNIEFQECLNNIRIGLLPEKTRKLLEDRVGAKLKNSYGIKPTKLYSTNYSVDHINDKELDKLAEKNVEFYEYNMEINVYPGIKNKIML